MNFRPAVKRLCAQLIWFNFLTLWHQALCWFGVHLMEVSHFIVTCCCLLPHFKTESSISLIHFILTLIWQEWNDYKRMCEIIGFVKKRKQDRAHNSEWHSLVVQQFFKDPQNYLEQRTFDWDWGRVYTAMCQRYWPVRNCTFQNSIMADAGEKVLEVLLNKKDLFMVGR